MSKRIIIVSITVVVVVLGVAILTYYFYNPTAREPEAKIYKFTGAVVGIEDETVTLHGVFDGSSEALPEDISSPRDFVFRADKNTSFKKIEIRHPTVEELIKMTGSTTGPLRYNIEDLPAIEGTGSLDDLKSLSNEDDSSSRNVIVEADFSDSIYGVRKPIASAVLYRVFSFPLPTSLPQTP